MVQTSILIVGFMCYLCVCCQQQESHHPRKRGARNLRFVEDQQDQKHILVKRGARNSNCFHRCPGGKSNCYNDSTINDFRCRCAQPGLSKYCDQIDCSSPIHCLNGGQCHLQNGGKAFNCTCADGYLGGNCQIDMCSPYRTADIVFVVDVSNSQTGTIFEEQKNFIKHLISQFPLGPNNFQFSLVVYASQPHVVFHLNNTYDNDTIIDAVDNVKIPGAIRGATFTGKALSFVRGNSFFPTNGGRSDVDRYVIIITDGMSSASLDTVHQATLLSSSYPNIRIVSIGSGEFVFHKELLELSGSPLNVFPLHGNDSVRSVQKTTMYGCERCTTANSDVVLTFDVSSFDYDELDIMLKTAQVLLANLHSDVNQTRVSVSKYENYAETVFDFDQFRTSNEMIPVMYKHIQKKETCMNGGQCSTGTISSLLQEISNNFRMNSNTSRRKAAIIFSQCKINVGDVVDVYRAVQTLKDNGVTVVVVGEGLKANIDSMIQMSTSPFFTFVIGEDFNTPVDSILSLLATLEYDICFV